MKRLNYRKIDAVQTLFNVEVKSISPYLGTAYLFSGICACLTVIYAGVCGLSNGKMRSLIVIAVAIFFTFVLSYVLSFPFRVCDYVLLSENKIQGFNRFKFSKGELLFDEISKMYDGKFVMCLFVQNNAGSKIIINAALVEIGNLIKIIQEKSPNLTKVSIKRFEKHLQKYTYHSAKS